LRPRQTLGGAVDAAGTLPRTLARRLLDSAYSSFTHAMRAAAVAGAALAAAMAVVVICLRNRPAPILGSSKEA